MRTFRRRLRQALLAAIPAAAAACSPSSGNVGSGATGTSATSATSGSGGTSGTSGTTGSVCAECAVEGLICDQEANVCVSPCSLCGGCQLVVSEVQELDGGYDDGGLPLGICDQACPDPDGSRDAGRTVGWTVLGCQPADCPAAWPDGGAAGPTCVGCVVQNCNGAGRAFEGLRPPPPHGSSAVRDYLARASHLEAASAVAFERLASELEAFGAPARLLSRVRRAADDERRHARITARMASGMGATPPPVEAVAPRPRSLVALAEENAAEGCVRETFGAAVAGWQAEHCAPEWSSAFQQIADDEAHHAELSWDIAAWADDELGDDQRRSVRAARQAAVAALQREVLQPREERLVELGLVPGLGLAERLVAEMAARFWR